jgi:hypothetical protein
MVNDQSMVLRNRGHAFSFLMRQIIVGIVGTSIFVGDRINAAEPASSSSTAIETNQKPTLAELEDGERKIREDSSLSHEQKLKLLQEVWKKETAFAGNGYVAASCGVKQATKLTAENNTKSQPVSKHERFNLFSLLLPRPKAPKPDLNMIAESKAIISVLKQKMYVFTGVNHYCVFPVSTSKYGLGDDLGSYKTPVGLFVVKTKIGEGLKPGIVFKSRQPTAEVVRPNAPNRDPIVTRIIWLQGLEKRNQHAYQRCIYIHGTPQEKELGHPASFGCVRMASKDVIKVYEMLSENTRIAILEEIDDSILRELHYVEAPENASKGRAKT